MASWKRKTGYEDVPVRARAYSPELHGQGWPGIDTWRREARDWLNRNPGRRLPCGDFLGVLRTDRDLKLAWLEAHPDQTPPRSGPMWDLCRERQLSWVADVDELRTAGAFAACHRESFEGAGGGGSPSWLRPARR
jgi:hypothetical protein